MRYERLVTHVESYTSKRSESARELRITLYKSDQQQQEFTYTQVCPLLLSCTSVHVYCATCLSTFIVPHVCPPFTVLHVCPLLLSSYTSVHFYCATCLSTFYCATCLSTFYCPTRLSTFIVTHVCPLFLCPVSVHFIDPYICPFLLSYTFVHFAQIYFFNSFYLCLRHYPD